MKTFGKTTSVCLFIVAFIFLFATKANAQTTDQNNLAKVEGGIRFMPVFACFNMETSDGKKIKGHSDAGFGGGTFMNYNFTRHLGMQIEMNYNSFDREYTESLITRRIGLKYIDIPLLLSFNSNKSRLININFVVGPQFGINAGSNVYTTGIENVLVPPPILSVRTFDLGLAYGFGIDMGINHKRTLRLGLGYRNVIGLLNISDNSKTLAAGTYYIMERTPLHTSSFYLGLSVLF